MSEANCNLRYVLTTESTKDTMNSNDIFNAYLNDECPICGTPMDCDDGSDTSKGGKIQSTEFECDKCLSRYRVGFNRGVNPIDSEILFENK